MNASPSSWPEKVFVLIPAYKAAYSLGALLGPLTETAPPGNICVIDDGSMDGTNSICGRFGVGYISHTKNQGKGAALTTGFRHLLAHCDPSWIITMDADGQHAAEDTALFIEWASRASGDGMCIGARPKKLSAMPPARILSNTVTSWILSLLTGVYIPDSQCGFRIYSAGLLRRITCDYTRFEMESEIILKAAHCNFQISHLQVQTLYFNDLSHIQHLRDTLRWIRSVLLVWWNLRKQGANPA